MPMAEKYKKSQRARSEPSLWPVSPSAPIVGRQRELTLVMNHYEAVKRGHAGVVLLTGEPGMGKTRLLDEVALRTAQDGAVVLRGSASEAEGMPPFLLFVEVLGAHLLADQKIQLAIAVANLTEVFSILLY